MPMPHKRRKAKKLPMVVLIRKAREPERGTQLSMEHHPFCQQQSLTVSLVVQQERTPHRRRKAKKKLAMVILFRKARGACGTQ
mmetsp:Transcript_17942/g.44817  ORF Transcript_17942/g.44817 Transcript_17942/m.44817 type:complete len:83 (+) Transcript_17942:2087-2335(+)